MTKLFNYVLSLNSIQVPGEVIQESLSLMRLKQCFAWNGMKTTVKDFVHSCLICQQSKYDHTKLLGLLQSLSVPSSAWQVVSLDFIEGLPHSNSYNCILVVVDLLTKYGHFIALKHPFTVAGVAKVFFPQCISPPWSSRALVSDRDRVFTSSFWSELFKLADVDLCRNTTYHPQLDGQTERVNQCLETYLRCFVHAYLQKWSQWLSSVEFWYNTCPHSAIGRTPFEAYMGIQLDFLLLILPLLLILMWLSGHLTVNGWTKCCTTI
jgi:hypothetical protein